MIWFPLLALLVLRVSGKGGGYSSGGYSGGYYGGSGVVTSRAAYASAGAFGAVVLLSAGSRRRYGVYNDPDDSSKCLLLSEEEMQSACTNLIGVETQCHDCIACETEDCMNSITNCDEFLATVFSECCIENCEEDDAIGIIIASVFTICICCGIGGCMWMRIKQSISANEGSAMDNNSMSGPGGFPNPQGAYQTGSVVQGTVVQGQVIGIGGQPAAAPQKVA